MNWVMNWVMIKWSLIYDFIKKFYLILDELSILQNIFIFFLSIFLVFFSYKLIKKSKLKKKKSKIIIIKYFKKLIVFILKFFIILNYLLIGLTIFTVKTFIRLHYIFKTLQSFTIKFLRLKIIKIIKIILWRIIKEIIKKILKMIKNFFRRVFISKFELCVWVIKQLINDSIELTTEFYQKNNIKKYLFYKSTLLKRIYDILTELIAMNNFDTWIFYIILKESWVDFKKKLNNQRELELSKRKDVQNSIENLNFTYKFLFNKYLYIKSSRIIQYLYRLIIKIIDWYKKL